MALAGCASEPPRPTTAPPPPAPASAPADAAAHEPLPSDMAELLRGIEAAYRKGDYDRGLALVRRTFESQKLEVSTFDRIGSVYYVLGRSGDALAMWGRALPLEKDPTRRTRLTESIALARRNLGLPEEKSAKPPRKPKPRVAPKADPEGSARQYKEGLRFYAEGSYLQATAAFLRALELDPANEEARKALERLRLQNGGATAP